MVGFVTAVVATPPRAVLAFAVDALLVLAAAAASCLPARVLARRMSVETPFVIFAVLMPFIGTGPRMDVFGIGVSVPGCWAAWSIIVKASLGVAAAIVLAWSTPTAEILAGLERLRCPRALVMIAGFMVRYLDLVAAELRRLQIARISRGDDPRWLWQGRAVATTAGSMFVRCFERGERLHAAMASRGFTGRFPTTAAPQRPRRWFPAIMWPLVAWVVALAVLIP